MRKTNELKPMWWVLRVGSEKLVAICDNEEDANTIKDFYETYKGIECVVRVAFTR